MTIAIRDFTAPRESDEAEQAVALPATEKQIIYARKIAMRTGKVLPYEITLDRRAISEWISATKDAPSVTGRFDAYPTSKQVQLAERLARRRRTEIPPEYFKDKGLMSKWIDSHL